MLLRPKKGIQGCRCRVKIRTGSDEFGIYKSLHQQTKFRPQYFSLTFSPLLVLITMACLGRVLGGGNENATTAMETDNHKLPPPGTRWRLEHYLAVNGPEPASEITFTYAVYPNRRTGEHLPKRSGYGTDRIWVADQYSPAVRVIGEGKTGHLLFFSAVAPESGSHTSGAEMRSPVHSTSQAVAKAREILRYFGKTEWCQYACEVQESHALVHGLMEGVWFLTIRRKERVVKITIDKHTGSLLLFSEAPAR